MLAQIYATQEVLKKLVDSPMSLKTGFKVSRLIKPVNDTLQDIEKQ